MQIISGGQTGADQAGLAAAKELGLETGGWLPKGCITDEGRRPDLLALYGMVVSVPSAFPPIESVIVITKWLAENNINVLNVAGNRESTNPGIFEFTKAVLLLALKDREL